MKFTKATKSQSRLRMALIGPSGSGKTYSALAIATHLVPGGRVAVIDTERGSAAKYADRFAFDTLDLETHSPEEYVLAIKAAEEAGYDVLIIDSLSHAWSGKDGALEQVDRAAARSQSGNSFTAWRGVTPKHNKLVDAVVSARCHVIATMRAKTEYAQDKDEKGRTVVRKIGLAAVQRDGMEYEFDVVGDIDLQNRLVISKTRCSALYESVIEKPGEALAKTLRTWLSDGAPAVERRVEPKAEVAPVTSATPANDEGGDAAFESYLQGLRAAADLASLDKAATGAGRPAKGTDAHAKATAVYKQRKAELQGKAA